MSTISITTSSVTSQAYTYKEESKTETSTRVIRRGTHRTTQTTTSSKHVRKEKITTTTTTTRKRGGEPLESPDARRQRTATFPAEGEQESKIDVVTLTFQELLEIFPKVIERGGLDYQTSIDRLREHTIKIENTERVLFTKSEGDESVRNNYAQLWVSVANGTNEVWLNMQLYKAGYDSNLLDEKQLYPSAEQGAQYDFLTVYEKHQDDDENLTLIFNVRCGEKGDLIYLSKGPSLTGDKVKAICFQLLESFPFTQQLYLYDDARINSLRLSTILSLADDESKAWYERNGCTPVSCEEWETVEGHAPRTQNAVEYHEAVMKMRTLGLNFFIMMLGGPDKAFVSGLVKKHFPITKSQDLTLHHLVRALYNASRQGRITGKEEAVRELSTFHDKFFIAPHSLPNRLTPLKEKFLKSLMKINNTILWRRMFDFSL